MTDINSATDPRAENARLQGRLDDLTRHLDRLITEEMAFAEFRGLLVQLAHPCGRNPLRIEADRSYTAAQIQAFLVRLLDAADRCANAKRRQRARQLAQLAAWAEPAQMALFESPAAGIERIAPSVAKAAGL